MDATKRKEIEAAGWKVGEAADFLGMSADERQLLDARVAIARAIRLQRESVNMSQKELGQRMKTSQPRVAKIERAASDVSLDQLVRPHGGRSQDRRSFGNGKTCEGQTTRKTVR